MSTHSPLAPVVALLLLGVAGCVAPPTAPPSVVRSAVPVVSPASTPGPVVGASPRTALTLLGTLPVKGRAPMTGYDRALYGQAWADTDRNGCDTRNDLLERDLVLKAYKPGTRGCVVLSGDLAPDPYTATRIHFVRGGASEVDIDHVVALGNSWATGAQSWPANKQLAFANDPLNLLAVDAGANRQKGAGDAATWLPSNKRYRCAYVARQVGVKAKYRLWVTRPEHDAIARVLQRCPSQVAPGGGSPTIAPIASSTGTTPTKATVAGSGTDPRFGTCRETKANGYGPYYEGIQYRDAESDGIVCE